MLKALAARVIRLAVQEWTVERAFHDFDDRTLKDIGIARSEVESPARWRRRNPAVGTMHTELPPGRRMS
jgi:uncharacterized protein YjiS (DUF1127 family)